MTDYKDLKSKETAGRFEEKANFAKSFIKPYGEKEYPADTTTDQGLDMAADIYRFGDDITKREYSTK